MWLKAPTRYFWLIMKQSKFNTDASHQTYKEIRDYPPVLYNPIARFTQAAEIRGVDLSHMTTQITELMTSDLTIS